MNGSRFLALAWVLVAAGCGSRAESEADGDVYVELQGEGSFYFEAVVSEVGPRCEALREAHGDDVAERCFSEALDVSSRAIDGDTSIGLEVSLCRGLDEGSSVDLGDPDRSCLPSGVTVTIGARELTATSGTIDVVLGPEADILVDAVVDDATDPDDKPIRVQAHLVLER